MTKENVLAFALGVFLITCILTCLGLIPYVWGYHNGQIFGRSKMISESIDNEEVFKLRQDKLRINRMLTDGHSDASNR